MRILLAVTALANTCSVFINVQANVAARARRIHMGVLPVANYPHFISDQYQEVGEKPSHSGTLKNKN